MSTPLRVVASVAVLAADFAVAWGGGRAIAASISEDAMNGIHPGIRSPRPQISEDFANQEGLGVQGIVCASVFVVTNSLRLRGTRGVSRRSHPVPRVGAWDSSTC